MMGIQGNREGLPLPWRQFVTVLAFGDIIRGEYGERWERNGYLPARL
jgi:hypothetical protein